MSISVICPSCASRWKAPDEAADRTLACPKCGHKTTVVCRVGAIKAAHPIHPAKNVDDLAILAHQKSDGPALRGSRGKEIPEEEEASPRPALLGGVGMRALAIVFLLITLFYLLGQKEEGEPQGQSERPANVGPAPGKEDASQKAEAERRERERRVEEEQKERAERAERERKERAEQEQRERQERVRERKEELARKEREKKQQEEKAAKAKRPSIKYKTIKKWALGAGGEGKVIVIDAKNATQSGVTTLAKQIARETRSEKNAVVLAFDDVEAAGMYSRVFNLSPSEEKYYDRHYMLLYNKFTDTGQDTMCIHHQGYGGPMKKIDNWSSVVGKEDRRQAEQPE